MAITKQEVEKLANFTRLHFSGDEINKLAVEMSGILNYVDQLKNIQEKSQGVEYVDSDSMNLMRDDFAENGVAPADLLSQSPEREGNYVKVKSVFE